MSTQFISLGILVLLCAMLPGLDFAIVTKNTLLHSRRAGMLTAIGVGTAILVHVTYCVLGLAVVIKHSLWLFSLIKYVGATYLVYLGIMTLRAPAAPLPMVAHDATIPVKVKSEMSRWKAFRQGFLCNLLNPKAMLFMLALFTVIVHPHTSPIVLVLYALETALITGGWFCALVIFLSLPVVTRLLARAEKYIAKLLGGLLIVLGIGLALLERG
jgi:RhtB (resistance to homoserine/threonine) family protein